MSKMVSHIDHRLCVWWLMTRSPEIKVHFSLESETLRDNTNQEPGGFCPAIKRDKMVSISVAKDTIDQKLETKCSVAAITACGFGSIRNGSMSMRHLTIALCYNLSDSIQLLFATSSPLFDL